MGKETHSNQFDEILADLLNHGLADEEQRGKLERLCAESPENARKLAEELEFSELIRQALLTHDFAEFEGDVRHRMSDADAESDPDFDELKHRLRTGTARQPDLNGLARIVAEDDERAAELRRDLHFDDLFEQAAVPSRAEEPFVESLATRMWAQTEEDHFVQDIARQLKLVGKTEDEAPENVVA
ncbi:MAG: hypothetical protein HKN23_07675, partial [Verrucomicrobiales bacterium]|nr:hypothetical protein [Verrucomicrobiales bacterium]